MTKSELESLYPKSRALFERAAAIIPGGIYGHQAPATVLPGASPYFATEAYDCRYRDLDGREYIDYLCGYGPVVLGHRHPEVEEAAEKQRERGDCFNHPTPLLVELAEWFVGHVKEADWAVFGKNGSDMTSWALQVAREHTKRKKIFRVRGAYHGTHPWCTPGHGGLIPDDRAQVCAFDWNDVDSFEALWEQCREELAAVIVTPYHHPVFADSEWAKEGFFKHIEERCREVGALVILDDIRAGFRLDIGGSHRVVGLEPDLICYSKAMGNGYPISAAVGRGELKVSASKVFLTGSYWNGAVSMAAALATVRVLEREGVPARLKVLGERLMRGLEGLGARYGLPMRASGPFATPYIRFEDDEGFRKQQRFCALAMAGGVFLHPHHNWFLSATHTEAVIDQTLDIAEGALRRMVEFEHASKP